MEAESAAFASAFIKQGIGVLRRQIRYEQQRAIDEIPAEQLKIQ